MQLWTYHLSIDLRVNTWLLAITTLATITGGSVAPCRAEPIETQVNQAGELEKQIELFDKLRNDAKAAAQILKVADDSNDKNTWRGGAMFLQSCSADDFKHFWPVFLAKSDIETVRIALACAGIRNADIPADKIETYLNNHDDLIRAIALASSRNETNMLTKIHDGAPIVRCIACRMLYLQKESRTFAKAESHGWILYSQIVDRSVLVRSEAILIAKTANLENRDLSLSLIFDDSGLQHLEDFFLNESESAKLRKSVGLDQNYSWSLSLLKQLVASRSTTPLTIGPAIPLHHKQTIGGVVLFSIVQQKLSEIESNYINESVKGLDPTDFKEDLKMIMAHRQP
jgi:hypothetical protein